MRKDDPPRALKLIPCLAALLAVTATAAWAAPASLLPLHAAATAPAPDASQLSAFLPPPDAVFIQKSTVDPAVGNVELTVQLGPASLERLQAAQGRTDFLVLGPEGSQVILTDDGQHYDAVAGDGLFTGLGNIDDADLQARANEDQATFVDTTAQSEPVFDNRVITGSVATAPFDIDAYLAGKRVPFNLPLVTVVSAEPAQPAATKATPHQEGLESISAATVTPGTNLFQEQALMIRDPSVVTDPGRTFDPCTGFGTPLGTWTFGHLVTEMVNQPASGIDPSNFTEQWLDHWLTTQLLNSFPAPARPNMQQLINDWKAASGGTKLDLSIAPFRLLAIVNRADLRHSTGGGGYLGGAGGDDFVDGGEARFIFGVVLPPGYQDVYTFSVPLGGGCSALPFTVIFEYGVPKCGCEPVRNWARQWVNLASLPFPSTTYNDALERITEQFVRRGANPLKPNGSAINQVRTNEIALQPPWELRQFDLTTPPFSFLHENVTNDTPDNSFNNTVTFSNYVLGGPRPVPLFFGGNPFLTGNPQVPSPGFFWNGPAPLMAATNMTHSDLRFGVGFNACNGCHARATNTAFVQVDPTGPPGGPAPISGFLSGIVVPDPLFPKSREFDDLERRERDLKKLARTRCFCFRPVNVPAVRTSLRQTGRLPANLFSGLTLAPICRRLAMAPGQFLRKPVLQSH